MKRLSKQLLVFVVTFILGVCCVAVWLYYTESQRIDVILPKGNWEPLVSKMIRQTNELAGVKELRETVVRKDDIEVRFWRGTFDMEGVFLRRNSGRWSVMHIKSDRSMDPQSVTFQELSAPKSGFDNLWKELTDRNVLTLPDADHIGCEYYPLDGTGFVAEVNQNHTYRIYRYTAGAKCAEARAVEMMDAIIGNEFSTDQDKCTTAEWFGCSALRLARMKEPQPQY